MRRMPGVLRRWLGESAAAAPPPEVIEFDALIDLRPADVPPGMDPAAAVRAVKAAVSAMPGAHFVNVGRHDGSVGGAAAAIRVRPPGNGTLPDGPAWKQLRLQVAAVVKEALQPRAPPSEEPGEFTFPAPQPGGFADGTGFAPVAVRWAGGPALAGARDRIAAGDASALDDVALAAALLSLVLPGDPGGLAARAVERFGSFAGLVSAPVRELLAMPGLGPHSVAALKLVHAAALRASQAGLMRRVVLDDMARLADYLSAVLARERIEQFRVLFLDAAQCLIADEAQGRGTVNHTPVYPREVVRRAIELRAAGLILVHNHPSGDPTPSREDVEMTATVRSAAALLGIAVRDHIIVGNGRWVSLREERLM